MTFQIDGQVKIDPRIALNRRALQVDTDVEKQLTKNDIEQRKEDFKTLDNNEKNKELLRTAEVNKAKNNPDVKFIPQSTGTLSDPKLDALKRRLIFEDPSKAV